MRPLLRQLLDEYNFTRHSNLKASVHFSELPCISIKYQQNSAIRAHAMVSKWKIFHKN